MKKLVLLLKFKWIVLEQVNSLSNTGHTLLYIDPKFTARNDASMLINNSSDAMSTGLTVLMTCWSGGNSLSLRMYKEALKPLADNIIANITNRWWQCWILRQKPTQQAAQLCSSPIPLGINIKSLVVLMVFPQSGSTVIQLCCCCALLTIDIHHEFGHFIDHSCLHVHPFTSTWSKS